MSDPQMLHLQRNPGSAVAAKSTESAWACSAGRSSRVGRRPSVAANVDATCRRGLSAGLGQPLHHDTELWSRPGDRRRNLETGWCEPVAAGLVLAAPARRRGQAEFGRRLPKLVVVSPQPIGRRRHQQIVAATADAIDAARAHSMENTSKWLSNERAAGRDDSGPPVTIIWRDTELATSRARWIPRTAESTRSTSRAG